MTLDQLYALQSQAKLDPDGNYTRFGADVDDFAEQIAYGGFNADPRKKARLLGDPEGGYSWYGEVNNPLSVSSYDESTPTFEDALYNRSDLMIPESLAKQLMADPNLMQEIQRMGPGVVQQGRTKTGLLQQIQSGEVIVPALMAAIMGGYGLGPGAGISGAVSSALPGLPGIAQSAVSGAAQSAMTGGNPVTGAITGSALSQMPNMFTGGSMPEFEVNSFPDVATLDLNMPNTGDIFQPDNWTGSLPSVPDAGGIPGWMKTAGLGAAGLGAASVFGGEGGDYEDSMGGEYAPYPSGGTNPEWGKSYPGSVDQPRPGGPTISDQLRAALGVGYGASGLDKLLPGGGSTNGEDFGNLFAPTNGGPDWGSAIGAILEAFGSKEYQNNLLGLMDKSIEYSDPFHAERPFYQGEFRKQYTDPNYFENNSTFKGIRDNALSATAATDAARGYNLSGNMLQDLTKTATNEAHKFAQPYMDMTGKAAGAFEGPGAAGQVASTIGTAAANAGKDVYGALGAGAESIFGQNKRKNNQSLAQTLWSLA